MVKLTNLDGKPIYLWRVWIQVVRHPFKGEYNGKAGAVLILSGVQQAVQETVDEAIKAIG